MITSKTVANRERAIGFVNISLVTPSGEKFNLRKGIPLTASNQFEQDLVDMAEQNPDLEINAIASIHVVKEAESKDLSSLFIAKKAKK